MSAFAGRPEPGTPAAFRRYWEEQPPLTVTWVVPKDLVEGAVVEGEVVEGEVYITGIPGQPVPRVGDTVIGPDDMGELTVKAVVWGYQDGFYPAPRGVQAVCEEL